MKYSWTWIVQVRDNIYQDIISNFVIYWKVSFNLILSHNFKMSNYQIWFKIHNISLIQIWKKINFVKSWCHWNWISNILSITQKPIYFPSGTLTANDVPITESFTSESGSSVHLLQVPLWIRPEDISSAIGNMNKFGLAKANKVAWIVILSI